MSTLNPEQIKRKLEAVYGWELLEDRLVKTYRFSNFLSALNFVNHIGMTAEHMQHHPEITIAFGHVTFRIWTRDLGGITEKDFELITEIEKVAATAVG